MESNRTLVERVHQLREAIRSKNSSFAGTLSYTIVTLLEYTGQLESASKEDLIQIKGINLKNVDYFLKLFQGTSVDSIAESVPINKPYRKQIPTPAERQAQRETGNWDGTWDNIVETYENNRPD